MLAAAATGLAGLPRSVRWFLSANPLPKGAAYACSGFSSRGGVSSFDARRLRGQSTIEYVLLIAIVALVVIVAGPGVASAIRNQFNTVTDAIGSGTAGENFYDAADLPDPQNGTAFAVYSEDDHSLMFYKRRGVPQVGDMFNYRKVTEVYTGFETAKYDQILNYDPAINNWSTADATTPWFDVKDKVITVKVVDEGIKPTSMERYFFRFEALQTAELSRFDLSMSCSMNNSFCLCSSLRTVKLSGISARCKNFKDAFADCFSLTALDFGVSDFSGANNFFHMFLGVESLSLNCSDWNVKADAEHDGFRTSDKIILPNAWK